MNQEMSWKMARKRSPEWDIGREVKRMKKWLREPGREDFLWDESRNEIKVELKSPDKETLGSISVNLSQMDCWVSTQGAAGVIEGKSNGWPLLAKGLLYKMWEVRVALAYYIDQRFPKKGAMCDLDLPLVFAHAIAFHQDHFVDWCGRILVDSYITGEGAFRDWKITPLSPFLVTLYAKWKSIDISQKKVKRKLGVYDNLFKYWDDSEKLSNALIDACDYHCSHVKPDEEDVAEFEDIPYTVFPAEILAYQRVRREMGMDMPTVEHPLLNTPLASPPDNIRVPQDGLLTGIAELASRFLPSIGSVLLGPA